MNKKKFCNMLNIILSAVTALYGFEVLANEHASKLYQEKDSYHTYIQGGYETLNYNGSSEFNIYKIPKVSLSLSIGNYYELESNSRLRGELETNFIANQFKAFDDTDFSLSYILFITGYYDMSISSIKGLYINFGAGIGISKNYNQRLKDRDLLASQSGAKGILTILNKETPKNVKSMLPEKIQRNLEKVNNNQLPDIYCERDDKEPKNLHYKDIKGNLQYEDIEGKLKLIFGTEYHMTDHFSISNQVYLLFTIYDKLGLIEISRSTQFSTGVFTWFKYSF